jgi:hypothetical protein
MDGFSPPRLSSGHDSLRGQQFFPPSSGQKRRGLMTYETWAMRQIREGSRCKVEGSMSCIPLRNDPICWACYEVSFAYLTASGWDLIDGLVRERGVDGEI